MSTRLPFLNLSHSTICSGPRRRSLSREDLFPGYPSVSIGVHPKLLEKIPMDFKSTFKFILISWVFDYKVAQVANLKYGQFETAVDNSNPNIKALTDLLYDYVLRFLKIYVGSLPEPKRPTPTIEIVQELFRVKGSQLMSNENKEWDPKESVAKKQRPTKSPVGILSKYMPFDNWKAFYYELELDIRLQRVYDSISNGTTFTQFKDTTDDTSTLKAIEDKLAVLIPRSGKSTSSTSSTDTITNLLDYINDVIGSYRSSTINMAEENATTCISILNRNVRMPRLIGSRYLREPLRKTLSYPPIAKYLFLLAKLDSTMGQTEIEAKEFCFNLVDYVSRYVIKSTELYPKSEDENRSSSSSSSSGDSGSASVTLGLTREARNKQYRQSIPTTGRRNRHALAKAQGNKIGIIMLSTIFKCDNLPANITNWVEYKKYLHLLLEEEPVKLLMDTLKESFLQFTTIFFALDNSRSCLTIGHVEKLFDSDYTNLNNVKIYSENLPELNSVTDMATTRNAVEMCIDAIQSSYVSILEVKEFANSVNNKKEKWKSDFNFMVQLFLKTLNKKGLKHYRLYKENKQSGSIHMELLVVPLPFEFTREKSIPEQMLEMPKRLVPTSNDNQMLQTRVKNALSILAPSEDSKNILEKGDEAFLADVQGMHLLSIICDTFQKSTFDSRVKFMPGDVLPTAPVEIEWLVRCQEEATTVSPGRRFESVESFESQLAKYTRLELQVLEGVEAISFGRVPDMRLDYSLLPSPNRGEPTTSEEPMQPGDVDFTLDFTLDSDDEFDDGDPMTVSEDGPLAEIAESDDEDYGYDFDF